jgi:hypothetical protein
LKPVTLEVRTELVKIAVFFRTAADTSAEDVVVAPVVAPPA